MRVIAFVGPSGTGKSHRALTVAYDNKSEAIIDDGLLIRGTKILAGSSAKSEQNKIQAVKRAIFADQKHADEVKKAISDTGIKTILVIGTSLNMALKICERLALPKPEKVIRIQDIASKYEISKARQVRLKEGKHIVPVPTVELKPHFTGILVDLPHRLFSRKKRTGLTDDKSIVRPSFSYYGKLAISDYVVIDIINIIVNKLKGVDRVVNIKVRRPSDPVKGMTIYMDIVLFYGSNIFALVNILQHKVKDKVELMTAMRVKEVNIDVKSLSVKTNDKR
ncbi:MAG TPA: Asp23/Gls24 family envelope stress response protein [Candidatus Avacidaminococcus intestinavium]|uniref:Asp23/Gls24 family envelope stress response protein n=1 Tax=Candidatus Avacidaminococcus intestinavium TaxID=2840684 RepID=A0A9D1MR01_9FIRM|nr:Asp23/Gls24 family envelope stress response protein [Candidatus Avacidaminococcus intestinavium]